VGRGPTTQDNSFLIFLKVSCHFRFVKPILCIETALRTFWTAGFGSKVIKMGAFYLLIANFFATQNIGGAKKACGPFVIKWRHLILINNKLKE